MVNEDVSDLCKHLITSILVPLPITDTKKDLIPKEGEESKDTNDIKEELKEIKRANLQEILSHPWFKEEEDTQIFTEDEVSKMREGFCYVDNTVTAIDKSIEEALDDEVLDEHDFKNITITSTHDPEKRNMSEKSDILDPFNTSVSGGDIVIDEEYFENNSDVEYYPTKEMGGSSH